MDIQQLSIALMEAERVCAIASLLRSDFAEKGEVSDAWALSMRTASCGFLDISDDLELYEERCNEIVAATAKSGNTRPVSHGGVVARCWCELAIALIREVEDTLKNSAAMDADPNDWVALTGSWLYVATQMRKRFDSELIVAGCEIEATLIQEHPGAAPPDTYAAANFAMIKIAGDCYYPTPNQAGAIKLLWEAAAVGRPEVPVSAVVDAYAGGKSEKKRWDDIFKKTDTEPLVERVRNIVRFKKEFAEKIYASQ